MPASADALIFTLASSQRQCSPDTATLLCTHSHSHPSVISLPPHPPSMISDWRAKWRPRSGAGAAPKPFLFVQLAPYTEGVGQPGDVSTAVVREAQEAALALPAVAMASAIDWGDTTSPLGNIHPRYKRPVGDRLALAARALAYNDSIAKPFAGPMLLSATNARSTYHGDSTSVTLLFDSPVQLKAPPEGACPVLQNQCAWLALDSVNATVAPVPTNPNALLATAARTGPRDGGAKQVSYLFGDWPVPTIFGPTGLPAAPFRIAVRQA